MPASPSSGRGACRPGRVDESKLRPLVDRHPPLLEEIGTGDDGGRPRDRSGQLGLTQAGDEKRGADPPPKATGADEKRADRVLQSAAARLLGHLPGSIGFTLKPREGRP